MSPEKHEDPVTKDLILIFNYIREVWVSQEDNWIKMESKELPSQNCKNAIGGNCLGRCTLLFQYPISESWKKKTQITAYLETLGGKPLYTLNYSEGFLKILEGQ